MKTFKTEPRQDYQAQCDRLRRINEVLVAALRIARPWMPIIPPIEDDYIHDCEIVDAALRSAVEKDEPA